MALTFEAHEEQIFRSAVYFTSCLFLGRAQYSTLKFQNFTAARNDAGARVGAYGRTPLIYAVDAHGHSVLLDRKHWPRWEALAKECDK